MLSSFFSKSKPINFIIVALYMLFLFVIAHYKSNFFTDSTTIIEASLGLVVYVISMLLLNYITQKNDLTQKSTHAVLLFAFLTTILTESLLNFRILLANLFVLLAVMNVLSFRNGKDIKAKILNASIYVSLASLAYFWSIGFVLLVFFGILIFEPKNYRNWLIPIIGWLVVMLFSNCYTLIFEDSFFSITKYISPISFSFDQYIEQQQLFSFGTIIICLSFFLFIYLIKYKRRSAKIKPVLNVVIAQIAIAIAIILIVPNKNTAELYFIAGPLAIIGTTYLEQEYGKLVSEVNVWVFLLLPFITLLF